jgi:hypothetical protein
MGAVPAPDEVDGDGDGVAQGPVGDAVAAVLRGDRLRVTPAQRPVAKVTSQSSTCIFMSVNPVFAALIGTVVLGRHLGPASWPAVIVTANAVAVGTAADRCRGTRHRPGEGRGRRRRRLPGATGKLVRRRRPDRYRRRP